MLNQIELNKLSYHYMNFHVVMMKAFIVIIDMISKTKNY